LQTRRDGQTRWVQIISYADLISLDETNTLVGLTPAESEIIPGDRPGATDRLVVLMLQSYSRLVVDTCCKMARFFRALEDSLESLAGGGVRPSPTYRVLTRVPTTISSDSRTCTGDRISVALN
jgi:hypothetical protein